MRLTALQLPARHGAPAEQLALVEELLEAGPPTDLVLLPEAALTGYVSPRGDFDLRPFAEPLLGPTRAALCRLAARFGCLVAGPLVEREGDSWWNTLLAVTPDGETLLHYRKRHPWYPEAWATPGEAPAPLVRYRELALTAAICFDVHFLADEAAEALGAADLLLFPSAWVDERDSLPEHLGALAAAHHVAVLNANWGQGSPRLLGQGGSLYVDERGGVVERLGGGAGRLDVER